MSALAGKRILVTRPRLQAAAMIEKLAGLGALPVVFPTIEIAAPAVTSPIDLAIQNLDAYSWVIFTSANGVSAFWKRLVALGKENHVFRGIRVAAIGPATAGSLEEKGIIPDFVPEEFVAEAILPGLGDVRGQRILLPRADIARKALVDGLEALGARPEEIAVYSTALARPSPEELEELERGVGVATFTSPSTVRNFFELLGERATGLLDGALIACIGPITAETARSCGLRVDLVAGDYTVDGLIAALLNYYETHPTKVNP